MHGYFRDWWQGLKPLEPAPIERGSSDAGSAPGEPAGAAAEPARRIYSADQPITSKDQDRFNRWPFAKRIADTIANGRDPSSLVIGLYGAWGDGKTSTLGLMQQALAEHPDVILLRFNPWEFASENQLLRGFFDSLADALGRSLPARSGDIGTILRKYGAILSGAAAEPGRAAKPGPGQSAVPPGEPLSSVELQQLRMQLEEILQHSGKRAVVLLDDIDRLEHAEIHTIFKLVQLSASFRHTSYVLAFDAEMVAAALGAKYGDGGIAAGRSFLEKIVHVPLHLPPAETLELRKIALEGVDEVMIQHGFDLTREQIERFTAAFVDVFEPQLQTPRQAKRFANAISFALPLLQGEANPIDVMLIEAIRVFLPRLYTGIRDNPDLFLASSREAGGNANAAARKRLDHLINAALGESGITDPDTIRRRLIDVLFPRCGPTEYGDDCELRWSREQRVCSREYFGRYFSYAVPPGDIGDVEVRQFIDSVREGNAAPKEIRARLLLFAERRAIPRLLTKLRYQEETLDAQAAQRVALAIAPNGALFPKETGARVFGSSFMQGAILIRQLLRRVPPNVREKLAVKVAQIAEPLSFAAECFHFMRFSREESAAERMLRPQAEALVGRTLASRIYDAAPVGELYAAFGSDTPQLLWLWKNMGVQGEMEAHLRQWLSESADAVDAFLAAFAGGAWEPGSAPSRAAEFRRDSYDRVAELIDPQFVLERLRAAHGDRLQDGQPEPQSADAWKRETGRRFAAMHDMALGERHGRPADGRQPDAGAVVEATAPEPPLPASAMPTLSPRPAVPPTLKG